MKNNRKFILLLRPLKEIWKQEPQALMMALGYGAAEALIPLLASLLSAGLVDGLEGGTNFGTLAGLALLGILVLFLLNAFQGKMFRCGLPHSEYCNDLIEWQFTEKNMQMDYARSDSPETARLKARVENDYDWGCGAYFMMPQLQHCFGGMVGTLCAAVLLGSVLLQGGLLWQGGTPVFFLLVGAAIFLSVHTEKKTCHRTEKLKEAFDAQSSRSNYLVRGGLTYREGKDIRIYKAQPMIKAALKEEERDRMVDGESRLACMAGIVDGGLSGFLMGGAYLFIVLCALNGSLSSGRIVLFAAAIYRFAESMKLLSRSTGELWMNAGRMASSFAFTDLPDALERHHRPATEAGSGTIEFRDVSYTYPGREQPALSHVSFELKPGRKIAIVGRNGSGKTTMVKLLCRLYDPDEGAIYLNGRDIREYEYDEYLRQFSVVFQDFRLLALPLGENVAGSKEYDSERVTECLVKAGFEPRLKQMKKGLATFLYRNMDQEGVEISGGEAQKVALARALYKDAPIVVLDEPTAALDPVSEHEVYSGFRRLVGEKTAIFISHRLTSCRFCDEILVFDRGGLIQRGSHEQLEREEKGFYHTMWQTQAQYYNRSAGC